MVVDWVAFTPWASLAGGLVIGLAAAVLALFNGRVAGISGIVAGLLKPGSGDRAWRMAFLVGVLASPVVYRLMAPLPDLQIGDHELVERLRAAPADAAAQAE